MTVLIPLKLKYRTPKASKRNPYRGRTGPRCCGPNCPSTYKKGQRQVKERRG